MEKDTKFKSAREEDAVSIGQRDKDVGNKTISAQEGSMLMGPEHPFFEGNSSDLAALNSSILPPGAVPAGARFDPITGGTFLPQRQIQQKHKPIKYPSGDPDPDDLLPPNILFS